MGSDLAEVYIFNYVDGYSTTSVLEGQLHTFLILMGLFVIQASPIMKTQSLSLIA